MRRSRESPGSCPANRSQCWRRSRGAISLYLQHLPQDLHQQDTSCRPPTIKSQEPWILQHLWQVFPQ